MSTEHHDQGVDRRNDTPFERETRENVRTLFSGLSTMEKTMSRVESVVGTLADQMSGLAKVVQERGQINWTMIGVCITALTLVWTVFSGFLGVIFFMSVNSVNQNVTRNEAAVTKVVETQSVLAGQVKSNTDILNLKTEHVMDTLHRELSHIRSNIERDVSYIKERIEYEEDRRRDHEEGGHPQSVQIELRELHTEFQKSMAEYERRLGEVQGEN